MADDGVLLVDDSAMLAALSRAGGLTSKAAEILGISKEQFVRWLRGYAAKQPGSGSH